MDVVDTKKLETAIIYLQRITEGNNPVSIIAKRTTQITTHSKIPISMIPPPIRIINHTNNFTLTLLI